MLLVSLGFCAGAAFYRFALESVVLKKRRKKREVDRVARRSVALRKGKDAIEGETHVRCRGGEEEEEERQKDEDKEGKETRRLTHEEVLERFQRTERTPRWLSSTCRVTF